MLALAVAFLLIGVVLHMVEVEGLRREVERLKLEITELKLQAEASLKAAPCPWEAPKEPPQLRLLPPPPP